MTKAPCTLPAKNGIKNPETTTSGLGTMASTMGRFLSPDWSAKEEPVPYSKLDNPQTLNLYSYVQNNPLSRIDADGHEVDFDQNAKKGVKLELKNVSRAERKMFQTTKNADGKSYQVSSRGPKQTSTEITPRASRGLPRRSTVTRSRPSTLRRPIQTLRVSRTTCPEKTGEG